MVDYVVGGRHGSILVLVLFVLFFSVATFAAIGAGVGALVLIVHCRAPVVVHCYASFEKKVYVELCNCVNKNGD
ncbi:hypothetical protein BpHYR1_039161 [Brachionus plicatilis]|uniref:Uncharacterized protein n=1 Tax=Brachionus plicatilis TaxID=10195 RepID=A0A3M7QZU0_BRAPC|nr:hypothetical protein BpHYR1_039161 [Brachionus plicatilis]